MDTKWKRFRYGTEERNPSWSFWGAMLGVLTSLFFCAIADDSRNLAFDGSLDGNFGVFLPSAYGRTYEE